MTPSILVLGGSGFIGRSVCRQLAEAFGDTVRITVPTRSPSKARALQALPGVELLELDVSQAGVLERLLPGHEVVIQLIAILQGSASRFEQVHVQLPRRLGAACAASGVRRLIHISALGVGEEAPSRYLRSKAAGEAALREAGLELTLLRPSVVFGADDRFLNLFAKLQARLPVLPLAGAEARFQPVWVEDVASAVVRCVQDRATIGQTYELAGPEQLSLSELVRMAGRMAGHARPILALPAPLAWLQARLMELMPGEPLMSRDNLASMRVPNLASGRLPGLIDLGIAAQSIAAVVPRYLSPGASSG